MTKRPLPTAEETPAVALMVAADALGIGKWTAYTNAPTGELCPGVPVLHIGGRYRVPTAPLRRALGLDVDDQPAA
jgi:hypothetical protein